MNNIFFTNAVTEDDSRSRIAFSWLLVLRWGSVACQVVLFLLVHLFIRIQIPVFLVAAIVLFQSASNLFFTWINKKGPIPEWLFVLVMCLDVVLLTLLLNNTGGAMNPFTLIYLVHITLCSILVTTKWSWGLMVFSAICYASLFFTSDVFMSTLTNYSLPFLTGGVNSNNYTVHSCSGQGSGEGMVLHLQGMWVAFAITAFFIVFFVGRIQKTLREHQKIVDKLDMERVSNEKLASLTTLAAGAAHEFSTPLATIAVASKEMLHFLEESQGDKELIEDVTLIRNQVDKCKEILFDMSAGAGEYMGELPEELSICSFLKALVEEYKKETSRKLIYHCQPVGLKVLVPPKTLKRTLKELLSNASDASEKDSSISVTCRVDSSFLFFEVQDKGKGMDQVTLMNAPDPFFTTKEVGKGLGLGLYLAKTLAERFGGELRIYSKPDEGTTVFLSFSLEKVLLQ